MAELPCHPCPHLSVCCRWGTELTDEEGEALIQEFGEGHVFWSVDDQRFRTQTRSGRCVFYREGGCSIHGHEHYPTMCADFPWRDSREPEAPRALDAELCPEMGPLED